MSNNTSLVGEIKELVESRKQSRLRQLHQYRLTTKSKPPRVLLLMGIPGSGKSELAETLEQAGWHVISQKTLLTRDACENKMLFNMLQNVDTVIDRCNLCDVQRRLWLEYADARGAKCGLLVLTTPWEECVERARKEDEQNESRLPPGDVPSRVEDMADKLQMPVKHEGFQFCRYIRDESDRERVLEELFEAN